MRLQVRIELLAEVVHDHAECAAVFQRHRIDFCCLGELTIETAAAKRGIELETLLEDLTAAVTARADEPPADPRSLSTTQFVDYITRTHHDYLRIALSLLKGMPLKVS